MPSMKSLIKSLKQDYPEIIFQPDKIFSWTHETRTITYVENGNQALMLHELGHAILHHTYYEHDIDLLKMENEAWEKAKLISSKYNVTINEEEVQDYLDSYRRWMHERSKCINCKINGVQIKNNTYRCPICNTTWTVNPALQKQLRRYKISKK